MCFRFFFVLILTVYTSFSFAQTIAVGRVVDAETTQPIENVSVYFNETQIGTKTNIGGRFYLETSTSKAKLVISCVGYQKVILDEVPAQHLKIFLKPINNTLKEVVISERNGWQKWGSLFTKLLMSDDSHDYHTQKYGLNVVLNPKAISFYFDRNENLLTASSIEPIWVINDRLGYLIKVDLDDFRYYVEREHLIYKSTLFFEPTKSSNPLENMQLATNSVYQGSITHFFNSLVAKTLNEEGFGAFSYSEIKNMEKLRVQQVVNKLKYEGLNKKQFAMNIALEDLVKNKDSLIYYKRIMSTPSYLSRKLDSIDLYQYLKPDTANKVLMLNIPDTIMLTYIRHQKTLAMHTDYINVRRDRREWVKVETLLKLTDKNPLIISDTGNPISHNWYVTGFMSSKRLASALPSDFNPRLPRIKVKNDALKNHAVFRDERP